MSPFRRSPATLWHCYYQEQLQIDGGKMDEFVAWSDAGSLPMSYFA